MKTKNEYIESLSAEMKEWSAQIDLLTARSENQAVEVKHKCNEELDAIRAKYLVAAEKMKELKELKEASTDAWEAAKQSAEKVREDLGVGLSRIASKFR
jgi:hypothetical protein